MPRYSQSTVSIHPGAGCQDHSKAHILFFLSVFNNFSVTLHIFQKIKFSICMITSKDLQDPVPSWSLPLYVLLVSASLCIAESKFFPSWKPPPNIIKHSYFLNKIQFSVYEKCYFIQPHFLISFPSNPLPSSSSIKPFLSTLPNLPDRVQMSFFYNLIILLVVIIVCQSEIIFLPLWPGKNFH